MNSRRGSWKRGVGRALILCILGTIAFLIWDDQTRVRPVEQTVLDALANITLGAITVPDEAPLDKALLDPVALFNQALAWHPELGPLKLVIWDRPKPPRGFRRRLISNPSWEELRRNFPIFHSSKWSNLDWHALSQAKLDTLILAMQLTYETPNGPSALGRRGKVLYLTKTAGTFEPLITRDFALDDDWVGDGKADLERFLVYDGCSASLLQPNRVRIRTTKAEMAGVERTLRAEQIPTLFERLQHGWTKLRNP